MFDAASNKRRTWFLFFPSLNWAMSSTALLVIINLVGRCGERDGEEQGKNKVMTVKNTEARLENLSRNRTGEGSQVHRHEKGQ